MLPAPAELIRRVMIRTGQGRLRGVWSLAHEALMRALAVYLRRGQPGAATYASGSFGSGEPAFGVSDVDIVVVVPGEAGRPGERCALVKRRFARLGRRLPLRVDLAVYEDAELEDAVSAPALTYGLDSRERRGTAAAIYADPPAPPEKTALHERPGLYGPMHGWRLLAGPDRRPRPPGYDAQHRRIAAWLQLQWWWRMAFRACLDPSAHWVPYFSVKLVAEPARIWLWLVHGESAGGIADVLARGLERMPEEEPALRRAGALHDALPRQPEPALGETLPVVARLSARIARHLESEVAEAGATEVRLVGGGEEELFGAFAQRPGARTNGFRPRLLPLTDWRSRASTWRPDEAFALLPGDAGDPAALAATARSARDGLQPALHSAALIVLPTAGVDHGHARLRAVQCSLTDPVSWALVEGGRVASFPGVAGWSARDSAVRAVAEHRAWLRHSAGLVPDALARPFNAARAALFLESLDAGRPELALTMGATARLLGARGEAASDASGEAYESYRAWRLSGERPAPGVAPRLHELVRALPAYS
jgi:predicted nucleotidyltransferase